MQFILLKTIVATDPTISCLFVLGHFLFANEETSVSAFDVMYSLKQATKFVCKAVLPNGTVGVGFDQVAVLEYITSDVVDDGSNEVD
jgi:hypothetical protein